MNADNDVDNTAGELSFGMGSRPSVVAFRLILDSGFMQINRPGPEHLSVTDPLADVRISSLLFTSRSVSLLPMFQYTSRLRSLRVIARGARSIEELNPTLR